MSYVKKMIAAVTFRTMSVLLIGSAFLISCKKENEQPRPTKNIVQVATDKPDFSTLIAAR